MGNGLLEAMENESENEPRNILIGRLYRSCRRTKRTVSHGLRTKEDRGTNLAKTKTRTQQTVVSCDLATDHNQWNNSDNARQSGRKLFTTIQSETNTNINIYIYMCMKMRTGIYAYDNDTSTNI